MSGSSTFSSALVRARRLKPWNTKPIFSLRIARQLVAAQVGHIAAVQEVPARGGAVEAAEEVHEGGLAGPGWSHHRHELRGVDAQADPAQGVDGLGPHHVVLGEILDLDEHAAAP